MKAILTGVIVHVFLALAQGEVLINSPASLVIGQDSLEISCTPNTWTVDRFTRILISRNVSGVMSDVVSWYESGGSELVFWFDTEVQGRGEAVGALTPLADAFLNFSIPANQSKCEDATAYRCTMTAILPGGASTEDSKDSDFIKGLAVPDSMNDIDVTILSGVSSNQGYYDYGTRLQLTCNATLGTQGYGIQWCIQRKGDPSLTLLTNNVTFSDITNVDGCQRRGQSTLGYDVTELDDVTRIVCEVSNFFACGNSELEASMNISVVYGRAAIQISNSDITILQDNLTVKCLQETSGDGLLGMELFTVLRQVDGLSTPLVNINGLGEIVWFDSDLESRAVAIGNMSSTSSAYLQVHINLTKCQDGGEYFCQLQAIDVNNNTVLDSSSSNVVVKALPDEAIIQAESASGETTVNSGLFSPGNELTLFCSVTLGQPHRNVTWCMKHLDDANFTDITTMVTFLPVESYRSCQDRQNSSLKYNVSSIDVETVFLCEAGRTGACGTGEVTTQFKVYAAEVDITLHAPSEVIAGEDDLRVTCQQSGSGLGAITNASLALIRIVSNNSNNETLNIQQTIAIASIDTLNNVSQVFWGDDKFASRGSLNSSLSNFQNAFLEVVLFKANLTCLDKGRYECHLHVAVGNDQLQIKARDERNLTVSVLPDYIKPITGTSNGSITTNTGVFNPWTKINLTCAGNVGNPFKELVWCIKYLNESDFMLYPNLENISRSVPELSESCQFSQESVLSYSVLEADMHTQFKCVTLKDESIENNSTSYDAACRDVYTSATYNLFSLNIQLDMATFKNPILNKDQVTISCTQTAVGSGIAYYQHLNLSRLDGDLISPLLALTFIQETNETVVTWEDIDMESRASVNAILSETEAHLMLTISANQSKCSDEGRFQCSLSAMTLSGELSNIQQEDSFIFTVLPDAIDPITGDDGDTVYENKAAVSIGTVLNITCTANVGRPPSNITWCYRRHNESSLSSVPDSWVKGQAEVEEVTQCQRRRLSYLLYELTEDDLETTITCQAGVNDTCRAGTVNTFFSVYAVNIQLDMATSKNPTLNKDQVTINCTQTAVGSGIAYYQHLNLSRVDGDLISPLLALTFIQETNETMLTWEDIDMESRTSVNAILSETEAYLMLTISANQSKCSDEGRFQCSLSAMTLSGELSNIQQEDSFIFTVLPDAIDPITGDDGDIVYENKAAVSIGTVLNITCTANVGCPPSNITWCYRRHNESSLSSVPDSWVKGQAEVEEVTQCQRRRLSYLLYEVTEDDLETTITCQAGVNDTCGAGTVNTFFSVYAVNIQLDLATSKNPTLNKDQVTINCTQTTVGSGIAYYQHLNLSRVDGDLIFPLLALTFIQETNETMLTWKDIDMESRTSVNAILSETEAYLMLTISANQSKCSDEGRFQCSLSAMTLSGDLSNIQQEDSFIFTVLPDAIDPITGDDGDIVYENKAAVSIGTVLNITCTANVGRPPSNITWCYRRHNESSLSSVPDSWVKGQAEVEEVTQCQRRRLSYLLYEVTEDDLETTITCQAGVNDTCRAGTVNTFFSIYAVDLSVNINSTTSILVGEEDLSIHCELKGSLMALSSVNKIQMWHPDNIPVVMVVFDDLSNSTIVTWFDDNVANRSSVTANLHQLSTFLHLHVRGTVCDDTGKYLCIIDTTDLLGRNMSIQADAFVNFTSLPEEIEPIDAFVNQKTVMSKGVFAPGSLLTLKCNATTGVPPADIYWCIRRSNDAVLSHYNNTPVILQSVEGCQTRTTAKDTIRVTANDMMTTIFCEVGNGECGTGVLSANFTFYADTVFAEVELEEEITLFKDNLTVSCMQKGSMDSVVSITNITLMRQREDDLKAVSVLSAIQKNTTTTIVWDDLNLQLRANATALLQPMPAYLQLHIPFEYVSCDDQAMYFCQINGYNTVLDIFVKTDNASVNMLSQPSTIDQLSAKSNGSDIVYTGSANFAPGSILNLTCSALVGKPASNITWCYRRINDNDFQVITTTVQSTITPLDSCNNYMSSEIGFTVTDDDVKTEILCEVGGDTQCGGSVINSSFIVYSVDIGVQTNLTTSFITGLEELSVSCKQLGNPSSVETISSVTIIKDGSNEILQAVLNPVTNATMFVWINNSWENRAVVSGNVQNFPASLGILIPKNLTTCEDGGVYICKISAIDISGQNIEVQDQEFSEALGSPESIEPIYATINNENTLFIGSVQAKINSSLALTCNGTIGEPPSNMSLCVLKDGIYSVISKDVTYNTSQVSPCQEQGISQLTYNVTINDVNTTFFCDIGGDCGKGMLTEIFKLFAEDVKFDFVAPTTVILGQDNIHLSCQQTALGLGLESIQYMEISKLIGFNYLVQVSAAGVTWLDTEFELRATAEGEVTSVVDAFLNLTVAKDNVTCLDITPHVCNVYATDRLGQIQQYTRIISMGVEALPNNVQIQGIPLEIMANEIIIGTCMAEVGKPSQEITWCLSRNENSTFVEVTSNVSMSAPVPISSCQFTADSFITLLFAEDTVGEQFQLKCLVGAVTCDIANASSTVNFTVVPPRPTTEMTTQITTQAVTTYQNTTVNLEVLQNEGNSGVIVAAIVPILLVVLATAAAALAFWKVPGFRRKLFPAGRKSKNKVEPEKISDLENGDSYKPSMAPRETTLINGK